MLVSVGKRGDAQLMQEIGCAAYLTKPFKQSYLYDCLATVVGTISDVRGKSLEQIITRHSLAEDNKQRMQILLAEDNLINQKVAIRILEKLGYQTETTDNGKAAIKALETKKFDLVLMDIQMPEMDGFEATKIIRTSQKVLNPGIPIIAMTAHAMPGYRERCLDSGMDDYLSKPIEPQKLSEIIKKHL